MYRFLSLCLLLALAVGMFTLSGVARGQTSYPLNYCLKGAFSTEEDFMSREIKPYDLKQDQVEVYSEANVF